MKKLLGHKVLLSLRDPKKHTSLIKTNISKIMSLTLCLIILIYMDRLILNRHVWYST